MALEDKIEELIAAIKENTAAVKGGASAPAKESKPASSGKATEKKKTTLDQVAKQFGAFLAAEGDSGKAAVRKILAHFGVGKVSEIEEGSFDEALALLKKFQDGEDPFGDDSEAEDLM